MAVFEKYIKNNVRNLKKEQALELFSQVTCARDHTRVWIKSEKYIACPDYFLEETQL